MKLAGAASALVLCNALAYESNPSLALITVAGFGYAAVLVSTDFLFGYAGGVVCTPIIGVLLSYLTGWSELCSVFALTISAAVVLAVFFLISYFRSCEMDRAEVEPVTNTEGGLEVDPIVANVGEVIDRAVRRADAEHEIIRLRKILASFHQNEEIHLLTLRKSWGSDGDRRAQYVFVIVFRNLLARIAYRAAKPFLPNFIVEIVDEALKNGIGEAQRRPPAVGSDEIPHNGAGRWLGIDELGINHKSGHFQQILSGRAQSLRAIIPNEVNYTARELKEEDDGLANGEIQAIAWHKPPCLFQHRPASLAHFRRRALLKLSLGFSYARFTVNHRHVDPVVTCNNELRNGEFRAILYSSPTEACHCNISIFANTRDIRQKLTEHIHELDNRPAN